jgi:hypothetical protein
VRKNIFCIIMIGLLSGVFTACTGYMDTCERYVLGAAFCVLSDANDGQPLYNPVVTPREFFDAVDFGRVYDGLYGNPSYWYDGDNKRYGNRGFRNHGSACDRYHRHGYTGQNRHDSYRDSESSIFGRYAPLMLPDVEYDKEASKIGF